MFAQHDASYHPQLNTAMPLGSIIVGDFRRTHKNKYNGPIRLLNEMFSTAVHEVVDGQLNFYFLHDLGLYKYRPLEGLVLGILGIFGIRIYTTPNKF